MHRSRLFGLLVAAVALLAFAGPAAAHHPGGHKLIAAPMTGAKECNASGVCGLGDPDGVGSATFLINLGQRTICYTITVSGIEPPFAAHIHLAPPGVAGPIVVPLEPPTNGSVSACATGIDLDLLKAIMKNPENYYVNVHNAPYPAGALRAQLARA